MHGWVHVRSSVSARESLLLPPQAKQKSPHVKGHVIIGQVADVRMRMCVYSSMHVHVQVCMSAVNYLCSRCSVSNRLWLRDRAVYSTPNQHPHIPKAPHVISQVADVSKSC